VKCRINFQLRCMGTAQIKDESANKEKSWKKAPFLMGVMFSRKTFGNNNLESNLQPVVYGPQSKQLQGSISFTSSS
jgi:hypothetical protein